MSGLSLFSLRAWNSKQGGKAFSQRGSSIEESLEKRYWTLVQCLAIVQNQMLLIRAGINPAPTR